MEIPRHWRLKKQRYGLVGEVCPHCDHKQFPRNGVCRNCGDEAKTLYSASLHESSKQSQGEATGVVVTALRSAPV